MTDSLVSQLLDLVRDPEVAGIAVRSEYTALGSTVTPPAGTVGADNKGVGLHGIFELPDGSRAATLDSWGSQARRWSNAVDNAVDQAGLPVVRFVADTPEGSLPENSSWTWSHKHADAIFRMHAEEVTAAGVDYAAIEAGSVENADALLKWFPGAILTGWWNSHGGKAVENDIIKAKALGFPAPNALQGSVHATKSARAMTSEIIAKGVSLRTRYAARVDSVFGAVSPKSVKSKAGDAKLTNLGFGSIPPGAAPKDVTFESIEGSTWISLTRLRAFEFHEVDPDRARAALVALALYGMARSQYQLHLRSGSDLILTSREVTIERHGADLVAFELPSIDELAELLRQFAVEFGWQQVDVDLSASKNLAFLLNVAAQAEEDAE